MTNLQSKKRKCEKNFDEYLEDNLYNLICNLEEKSGCYLNFENIVNDFKISIKSNNEGMINRCTACGTDMGRTNPRQLCGKTYCHNEDI